MPKVALIVGHGDRPDGTHDPGAVGGGWTEQTAGQVVGWAAAVEMMEAGVVLDPNETLYPESDPNYIKSTADANRAGADLVLSIHHDWIKAPTGAFALWTSDAGRQFGIDIEQAVERAGFPLRTYTANPRNDLYLLNEADAPAVIFECGRIGEDALDTEQELEALGRAIGRGVLDHLGIEHQEDDMPTVAQIWAHPVAGLGDPDDPPTALQVLRAARRDAYTARVDAAHNRALLRSVARQVGLSGDEIASLAADHEDIAALIADAEGLTVAEARKAISAALENTRLTVDDPDA